MSIYQKLLNIQSKISAPKNQYNNFGKYHYRSCEDILKAIKPLLTENKCILTIDDDIKHIEGRYYVEATAKLINCEKEDSYIETKALARESEQKKGMDESQITGSTSSYARKYALNGLLCLDDEKDADSKKPENGQKNEQNNQKRDNKPNNLKDLGDGMLNHEKEIKNASEIKSDDIKPDLNKFWASINELGFKEKDVYEIASANEGKEIKDVSNFSKDKLKRIYTMLKSQKDAKDTFEGEEV